MLIEELIQNVQSEYSKGVQSKDTRLADRHIYSVGVSARETVLTQQANKNQVISDWNYQILPCVEMEPQKINPLLTGHIILRSKYKIPRVLNSLKGPLFKSITSLDGSITYDPTSFSDAKYNKGNKFTANKPKIFMKDNYMFLTNSKHIEALSLMALFSDPLEAALFTSSCAEDCVDCVCKSAYEHDFYLDGRMIQAVVDIAVQKLIVLFSQMKEDKSNNASDDNSGQVNYRQTQSNNNNGE